MSVISLKNVSRNYGKTLALDRINLDLKEGEILGFIGYRKRDLII